WPQQMPWLISDAEREGLQPELEVGVPENIRQMVEKQIERLDANNNVCWRWPPWPGRNSLPPQLPPAWNKICRRSRSSAHSYLLSKYFQAWALLQLGRWGKLQGVVGEGGTGRKWQSGMSIVAEPFSSERSWLGCASRRLTLSAPARCVSRCTSLL